MEELPEEREAAAEGVRAVGARPVMFEEFGGRDANPVDAYLGELETCQIYLGILGRRSVLSHKRRVRMGLNRALSYDWFSHKANDGKEIQTHGRTMVPYSVSSSSWCRDMSSSGRREGSTGDASCAR